MCGYESCISSPGMYSSLISMGSLQYNKLEDRSRDTQNIIGMELFVLDKSRLDILSCVHVEQHLNKSFQ